jgi:hypothetical protein
MANELGKAVRLLGEKASAGGGFVPAAPAPIPDSAGKAANVIPKGGSAGGDLAEQSYSARTYHPRKTIQSTDGVITWQFDPIKSIAMVDGSGSAVKLTFAEPS